MKDDHDIEVLELVAGARREFSPRPADAQRVLATVRSTLSATQPTEHVHSDSPASQSTAETGIATKLFMGVAGLSVATVAIVLLATQPTARPSPPVTADPHARSEPLLVSESSQLDSNEPAPQQPARVPAADRAPRVRERKTELDRKQPNPAPPTASLQVEIAALRRVDLALREGHANRALSILEELDRVAPNGKLYEERGAALAVARCALEPTARAAVFQDYSQRHPASMYLRRVERGCRGE